MAKRALVACLAALFFTAPADAGHLLKVTGADAKPGDQFASTTTKYWAHSKVYRRDDRFEYKLDVALDPAWQPVRVTLHVDINGPPGLSWDYDEATCDLFYLSEDPPPPPAVGGCQSTNGTISFKRFEGYSPVLEIRWKRPLATNVRVGRYRILANIQLATLIRADGTKTTDCVSDVCQHTLDPLYVVFNPYQASTDTHVTGLPDGDLASYAIGDTDKTYYAGPRNVTLRPASQSVFLTAVNWVDAIGTTSAKAAIDEVTRKASGFVPGSWPPPTGGVMKTGNIPDLIQERGAGVNVCGQCMVFGALTTAFDRAVGVPSRMLTAEGSYIAIIRDHWNFHVWSEVWLNEVTAGDWSAHDASKGLVSLWETSKPFLKFMIHPVTPWARQSVIFKQRFTKSPGYTPQASTTNGQGAEIDVTSQYNPHPTAPAVPSSGVAVMPATRTFTYGRDIHIAAAFRNPGPRPLRTRVMFSLAFESLGAIRMNTDNLAYNASARVTIPARGTFFRMYRIPLSRYRLAGTFAARASLVDAAGRLRRARSAVRVESGLSLRLSGPASITPGHPTSLRIEVTNRWRRAIRNVQILLHIPDYLQPSRTSFRVSLRARRRAVLTVRLTPTDALNEAIEAQASAPGAGVALASLALGRR